MEIIFGRSMGYYMIQVITIIVLSAAKYLKTEMSTGLHTLYSDRGHLLGLVLAEQRRQDRSRWSQCHHSVDHHPPVVSL